jgi:predicted ribosomally synthesized peptide with SipW-like signal peptide
MGIQIQITRNGRTSRPASPRTRRTRKVFATLFVLGIVGLVAGVGSYSAFTATTSNTGNSFASGTVAIEDNDGNTAMLSLANAKPGDSDTSCIKVKYTGSLASTVRLYGSISGAMTSYMTVTITRGTDASPVFDNCTNFVADATNYIGAGNGVMYQGALNAFPSTYAAGVVDPTSGSPESWTTNEEHVYKITVSLDDQNAAQGQNGNATFTWEARNQ